MSTMIASRVREVNPMHVQQRAGIDRVWSRVTPGCAAAPRFIQVHPTLLELRAEDFAAYLLLCERFITGRYPEGVPLSGADLARYFEADASPAAATRYT